MHYAIGVSVSSLHSLYTDSLIINDSAINSIQATPPPNECGCLNGGTCMVRTYYIEEGGGSYDVCPGGFNGVRCENETSPW